MIYERCTKPLRGSFSSVFPTSFWGLRYIFFIMSFWLVFFAGNWSFSFSLFQEYAMLLTVIIMKIENGCFNHITYLLPKLSTASYITVLSIIPLRNSSIWFSDTASAWSQKSSVFFGGTIDKTLIRYLQSDYFFTRPPDFVVCWQSTNPPKYVWPEILYWYMF